MSRDRRVIEELLTVLDAAQAAGANSAPTAIIKEGLDNVRAMLADEDRGWDVYIGGHRDEDEGLTLSDLKQWAARIQEQSLVGWMKKGFSLRSTYIWQGEIQYDKIPSESRGKGVNVQAKIDDPVNQRAFFGPEARIRREKRLYAEGIALWIGNDQTKELQAIPLSQITDTLGDPDDESIIWAYKREWSRRQANGKYKDMKRWYFVDTYKDHQLDIITVNGIRETVETDWTAFDMHANSVEGWKFGFPDALGAWIWNERAKDAYGDGLDVTAAMASILYLATGRTAGGAQNAANQFASAQGAAGTAVVGAGNAVTAMSTAGKAFDFSQLREIVAVIASNLDVSNIALTSNPGDAGSSYGSAATLDEPTRLAMEMRRLEHVQLDKRVLRWMAGPTSGKDIKVYFRSLASAAELYRLVQAVVLKWQQGLMRPEDAAEQIDDIFGIPSGYGIPDGVLIPNNTNSLNRKDIDTDGEPGATNGAQAAAPTQGRGGKQAGGSGERPTDTRSDTLSK